MMSRMVSTASAFGRGWFSRPYPLGPIAQATVWGSPPPCASVASCPARSSRPRDLVAQARRAEEAGFDALWISDHYHPWNDEQGHSPFVWSVIGAISQVTEPAGHDRRDLPDGADPSRDRRPGRGHERR